MTVPCLYVLFLCVCVQDLELALRRFESGGLSGIVELEGSIETTKQSHLLIQQAGLGVRGVTCALDGTVVPQSYRPQGCRVA